MLSRRTRQGGFTFIGIIICLAIVGILSQQYFSTDTPDGKMWVQSQFDKARNAATSANLRSAQTQFSMWQMDNGRLSTKDIAVRLDDLSTRYGNGGRFFVGPGDEVMVTTQLDTPTFAERMKLPTIR